MSNELRPVLADQLSKSEQLYIRNRGAICDKILINTNLFVTDGETVADLLTGHLTGYNGPPDDEAFIAWAVEVMQPEIDRRIFFYKLHHEYGDSVRAGIRSVLGECLDLRDHTDPAFILEQIENNSWSWVWERIDKFLTPGSAAMATRLFAAARFQARTWRQDRLRQNKVFDDSDVERYGHDATGKLFFHPDGDDTEEAGNDIF